MLKKSDLGSLQILDDEELKDVNGGKIVQSGKEYIVYNDITGDEVFRTTDLSEAKKKNALYNQSCQM